MSGVETIAAFHLIKSKNENIISYMSLLKRATSALILKRDKIKGLVSIASSENN